MRVAPIEFSIRASEVSTLADLILEHADGCLLDDSIRTRIADAAALHSLSSLIPFYESLERDPAQPSGYYLLAETWRKLPILLNFSLASDANIAFREMVPIGRVRPKGGRELLVNAIPFSETDASNVETFLRLTTPVFLPRPAGHEPCIVVAASHAGAAFDGFRTIRRTLGVNVAALSGSWYAAVLAVLRAGWRDGYSIWQEITVHPREMNQSTQLLNSADRYRDIELVLPSVNSPSDADAALTWWKEAGNPVHAFAPGVALRRLAEFGPVARSQEVHLSATFEAEAEPELWRDFARATAGFCHVRVANGVTSESLLSLATLLHG